MANPEAATIRVLFDATRLLARGGLATPTGIDRVDFAYVSALSTAPGVDLRLITFDVFGPKLLAEHEAAHLIRVIRQRWQVHLRSKNNPVESGFQRLRIWLEAAPGTIAAPSQTKGPTQSDTARLRSIASVFKATMSFIRLRRSFADGIPSVYVNTSHGRLFRRTVSNWLAANNIGTLFFIHDLIPIEYPEFNRQLEPARHAARLKTVSAHADQIIVNSEATRKALLSYMQESGQRIPSIHVLHLGIENRFSSGSVSPQLTAGIPYFVVLGTIEPRKNHQLLLQIWRRLIEAHGDRAPRLVLVGRRGWENQTVFNILDRSHLLSQHVIECSGLSDGDLTALLKGAQALLMPSFAEGYGLPVAEALSLGTPVIASAIAAHREVGGDYAEYLDPLDGLGWTQAIIDYAQKHSSRRNERLKRLHEYRAPSWDAHFTYALKLVQEIAHSTRGQV